MYSEKNIKTHYNHGLHASCSVSNRINHDQNIADYFISLNHSPTMSQ